MSLDVIGIYYGTDKSSLRNDYLRQYERLWSHLKCEEFNFIEIGIHSGASLSTWQAYFHNATIIGLDVYPHCRAYARARIKVEIGSQDDAAFLAEVAAKYPPKVVIDDGSHRPDHQIFSFEELFPKLKPAGCYVVEDLSADRRSPERDISATAYFGALQEGVMSRWRTNGNLSFIPPWASTTIARIDVFPGAVAVWKHPKVDAEIDLPWIEDIVFRSGCPDSLLYLSEYLDRRAGQPDHALEVARRGADLAPNHPWLQVRIADVLSKLGDIDGAVKAARNAVELRPDTPFFAEFLERLKASANPR